MRHNGTEYGYVLSGRLQVSLGFDNYVLEPGDSISFDCTQPHRFSSVGDDPVEAVWFVVGRRNTQSVEDLQDGLRRLRPSLPASRPPRLRCG
jgi:quercetin dioxygenase-like cupin family protein